MKKTFNIKGMHCASCSKIIEMELEGKVILSNIDFKSGKATITFDEKTISAEDIKGRITKLGYSIA